MTPSQSEHAGAVPLATFVERCRTLRVPCVHLVGDTPALLTPGADPALHAWLAAVPAARWRDAALALSDGPLPGCRVVPLQSAEHADTPVLAVVIPETALDTLPSDALRAAIAPWVQRGQNAADTTSAILAWLRDDAAAAYTHAALLNDFSTRLIQVYEESHALFRIMRVMASGGSSRDQVQLVCNQIHQIFPFSWMCITFKDDGVVEDSLRAQFILDGQIPCPPEPFRGEVAKVLAGLAFGGSSVLDPASSPLAALVGSEIICEPILHDNSVIGVLMVGNKLGPDPGVASPEIQFLDAAADFLGTFHENAVRFAEQRAMALATIGALTATIDAKDPYTRGHSERVAHLTEQIALAIGQSPEAAARARIAGTVHDIGKIGVPDAVLCKAGRLTDDEFAAIKRHPEIGHRILKDIRPLRDILPGVLHHHERWDGRGYPHKLAGENIELIARIIGLADAFDAMSSNRSYRAGLSRDHVLQELTKGSGTQFDPALVKAFLTVDLTEYDHMVAMQAPPTIITSQAA
jgi:HD-GYP domain-containing protein (c-di-GMP phosphodiesterase class II)